MFTICLEMKILLLRENNDVFTMTCFTFSLQINRSCNFSETQKNSNAKNQNYIFGNPKGECIKLIKKKPTNTFQNLTFWVVCNV